MRRNGRPSDVAIAWASVVLPTPGHVLDQQVTAGQQAGQALPYLQTLADDYAADLGGGRAEFL